MINLNTVENLIDKQTIAYAGSISKDSFPTVKAMFAPQIREGRSKLYFTTNL